MTKKLFGTDGVRGVAGEDLTAELAHDLGRAATQQASGEERPQVLIIRDTRESGPMLEEALAAGIAAAGGDALIAGVLPTPGASILVRRLGLDLAAVVSASHNPWQDNGIKFFDRTGAKLSDQDEAQIEASLGAAAGSGGAGQGTTRDLHGALDDYIRELAGTFDADLSDLRVVLDCANGSAFEAAPAIFSRLGARVDVVANEPDGRNINEACGSTHPEALARRVVESGAHIGFAYDGDGDRVVAVDAAGSVRDGDELISLIAPYLRDSGGCDGVAVTVMSNYGFHSAMDAAGIEVATTPVGDRYVSEELSRRGWSLGGEQSGHLIWRDFAPTGDGIAASLLVCRALAGRVLADAIPMRKLPQTLVNVRVKERDAIETATAVWEEVDRESQKLEGRGRVLLRPSGTEPLVRVMVEAPEQEECESVAARLVAVVEATLA